MTTFPFIGSNPTYIYDDNLKLVELMTDYGQLDMHVSDFYNSLAQIAQVPVNIVEKIFEQQNNQVIYIDFEHALHGFKLYDLSALIDAVSMKDAFNPSTPLSGSNNQSVAITDEHAYFRTGERMSRREFCSYIREWFGIDSSKETAIEFLYCHVIQSRIVYPLADSPNYIELDDTVYKFTTHARLLMDLIITAFTGYDGIEGLKLIKQISAMVKFPNSVSYRMYGKTVEDMVAQCLQADSNFELTFDSGKRLTFG